MIEADVWVIIIIVYGAEGTKNIQEISFETIACNCTQKWWKYEVW